MKNKLRKLVASLLLVAISAANAMGDEIGQGDETQISSRN
jgi:hypothetical protein